MVEEKSILITLRLQDVTEGRKQKKELIGDLKRKELNGAVKEKVSDRIGGDGE